VWGSKLIGHVAAALGLPDAARHWPVSQVAGYPHIAVLATPAGTLVLKRINASMARSSWFDGLYTALAARQWVATPRRTTTGTYTIPCDRFVVIALDWLSAPMVRPTSRWWATTLADLHSVNWIGHGPQAPNVIGHRDAGPAVGLLNAAKHLFPADVHAA
jgi:hypothetical protein